MRFIPAMVLTVTIASPALAQRAPEIVIPGKAGVPVYINGVDASWGVVEGDFGLDRPGMVVPTVTYRVLPAAFGGEARPFLPTTGRRPGYGRLEVVPPPDRPVPPPAPTYYRNWSSGSASGPATDYPPYAMPNVEISPYFGRRGRRSGRSSSSGGAHAAGSASGSGSSVGAHAAGSASGSASPGGATSAGSTSGSGHSGSDHHS